MKQYKVFLSPTESIYITAENAEYYTNKEKSWSNIISIYN